VIPRKYDLLVSPVHCPDSFLGDASFCERMTFHEAVSLFIGATPFRIEVTGVKGKTSLCYLLAHILSLCGRKVFLHTSRGQGPYHDGKHDITDLRSIAPTSLLALPEGDYDTIIAEVSLGGTGKADIGIITNIAEDYGIASDTRKASDAKASVLSATGINIVRKDELSAWRSRGEFKIIPYGDSVKIVGTPELGRPLTLKVEYSGKRIVSLKESYLALQYVNAVECALTVCSQMNVPTEDLIEGLNSFQGVPGRGELCFEDDIWIVTERNPGISHMSIAGTLSCLKEAKVLEGAVAVIDPINRKVCDKLKMNKISEVFDSYGVKYFLRKDSEEAVSIPADAKVIIEFIKEGYQ
jgi:UDP-N-acetylmuramyl pentapeptide synthase